MDENFASHGYFSMKSEHNLLIIDAYGPWNKELFTELHQQLYVAVHKLQVNNYGLLVVLHGQALPVKEAIDYHIEFIKQGNPVAIAIDLSKCSSAGLSEDVFSYIYKESDLPHSFFNGYDIARHWQQSK